MELVVSDAFIWGGCWADRENSAAMGTRCGVVVVVCGLFGGREGLRVEWSERVLRGRERERVGAWKGKGKGVRAKRWIESGLCISCEVVVVPWE